MSANHHERVTNLVKNTLKTASMGEPFGFSVSPPAWWPFLNEQGQVISQGPAWFIVVTIRDTNNLTGPDIKNGFPVPGILPADEDFRIVAQKLLEQNRRERDGANGLTLAGAPTGPSMSLADRPKP